MSHILPFRVCSHCKQRVFTPEVFDYVCERCTVLQALNTTLEECSQCGDYIEENCEGGYCLRTHRVYCVSCCPSECDPSCDA